MGRISITDRGAIVTIAEVPSWHVGLISPRHDPASCGFSRAARQSENKRSNDAEAMNTHKELRNDVSTRHSRHISARAAESGWNP